VLVSQQTIELLARHTVRRLNCVVLNLARASDTVGTTDLWLPSVLVNRKGSESDGEAAVVVDALCGPELVPGRARPETGARTRRGLLPH
jgi:hypothetical protein